MFERKWTKILPVLQSERLSVENSRVAKAGEPGEEGLPMASAHINKKEGAKGKEPGALKRIRQDDVMDSANSPSNASRPIKCRKISHKEAAVPKLESNLGNQVIASKPSCAPDSQSKKKKGGGQAARSADSEALETTAEGKHGSKARKQETFESSDVGLEHVVLCDCLSMLDRLLTARGGHYFAEPVDAEALGLADYYVIVTEPLDFSTIRARLLSGFYLIRRKSKGGSQAFGEQDGVRMREAFGRDVRKVLDNALLYNPESDSAYKAAASILEFFNSNWTYSAPVFEEPSKKKEKKKSVGSVNENGLPFSIPDPEEPSTKKEKKKLAGSVIKHDSPLSVSVSEEPQKKKEKKKLAGPCDESVSQVSEEPSKKKEKKKSVGPCDESVSQVSEEPSKKKEKKKSVGSVIEDVSPDPKKQKVPKWLQKCKDELSQLMVNPDAACFLEPINAKALRLKDYHKMIQRPMDLGTIKQALESGSISKYEEFNDMVSLLNACLESSICLDRMT
jgi:hypothetical protein